MQLEDVRNRVQQTLSDLGLGTAQPIGERVLLQDRFYVGRRFEFEGVSALWLTEAQQIKFYNAEGKFLTSLRLDAQQPSLRRAA